MHHQGLALAAVAGAKSLDGFAGASLARSGLFSMLDPPAPGTLNRTAPKGF